MQQMKQEREFNLVQLTYKKQGGFFLQYTKQPEQWKQH